MFGLRLRGLDQRLDVGRTEVRIRHDRERRGRDQADRRDVLERIEAEIGIEERIGDVAGQDHHQRLAVRLGGDQRGGRGRAVRARTVLDDDRLAEHLLQLARDVARDHVGGAARRKADQPADRAGRPGLRGRAAKASRQNISAAMPTRLHRVLPILPRSLQISRDRSATGSLTDPSRSGGYAASQNAQDRA